MKTLIIADDLTGALDTAVQFAKRGVPTLVTVDREADPAGADPGAEALAIDAETRHLTPREAYDTVYRIARRARDAGVPQVYKKVDSSLRGNIGAEIAAVMDARGCRTFCFAPAFPQNGRTTRGGRQYCYGRSVHRTAFAHDPYDPVRTDRIRRILRRQTDRRAVLVRADGYARALAAAEKKPAIYVFDADTQADLDRLAETAIQSGRCCAMGGSAGLAASLSERLSLRREPPPAPPRSRATLYLIGSVHQASLEQIAHAAGAGYPVVCLTAEQQLENGYFDTPAGRAAVEAIARQRNGRDALIVCTLLSREQLAATAALAARLGLDGRAVSARITENMGRLTRLLLNAGDADTLVVFGGDTLLGVMNSLGCRELRPLAEAEPGIVVSRAAEPDLLVVTKAGGFGARDVIPRIERYLRQE